jgi:hypothetical protein
MSSWLLGISIAGFFVSLLLSFSMYPKHLSARKGRSGVLRWWIEALSIAAVGMGLAYLFAWPAWKLGEFIAPLGDISKTTVGAISACIFGLGGSALTGAIIAISNETRIKK